jgi:uncharacterized protein involved in response to NO
MKNDRSPTERFLPAKTLWLRGFRPFFLGAVVLAVVGMSIWMAVYLFHLSIPLAGISIFQWHAHEMIFGYTMAVIAGFLLTAAQNWTGEKTLNGAGLALLFFIWVIARVLMLSGAQFLLYTAIADLFFMLLLGLAVARPILKVGQKRQAAVLIILVLLTVANLLFYLGALGQVSGGAFLGIHAGLYLVLGMVLFMGSRVIPFFTKGGVGYSIELKNERWNDVLTVVLYPLFLLSELIFPQSHVGAVLAAGLFISNSIRVMGWHTLGIWQRPLLWGLFSAFVMINLGFLMRALMPVTAIPDYLPVHAYAVGGIGLVTVSMMARVTLGHTGRNVHQAPPIMILLLVGIVLTASLRIFFPLFDPSHYRIWIGAAGVTWIVTFSLFAIVFFPMLVKPRADGKHG